jgi:TrmH family RNA methyltransferase
LETLESGKFYKKLFQKKYREKHLLAVAEGKNAVEALVENMPNAIKEICVAEGLKGKPEFLFLDSITDANNANILYCTDEAINRVTKNSGGIFAVFFIQDVSQILRDKFTKSISKNDKQTAIVLSSISDPGNLGTVIRAANAFWADAVFLTKNSVDEFNEKVIRSSAGSIFKTPIIRDDFENIINFLKKSGFTIIATSLSKNAKELAAANLKRDKSAFVFGNEAHGLSNKEIAFADEEVFIPISENVESLNLAGSVNSILALKSFLDKK